MSKAFKISNRNNSNGANKHRNSSKQDEDKNYKKIGNYILSDTLGTGTFSKVKLGIHIETKQKVAIKILDKDKIKDDNDIERISREIHILQALRHPNIAQLFDTFTSEKHIYIVMEYMEGKDLLLFVDSRNFLTEIKASSLFRQLISALEYIHTLGIVHRDIKPENILLDKKKKIVKLVDFGLSNSYKHGTLLKTACGSPCYASPEMIGGKEYNGLYSDLWSCGVVLYFMLIGKLPFDDENISVLYRKIKSAEYIMPDFISEIAKDFINKILTTNPNKRIRLEEVKKHPFFLLGMKSNEVLPRGILIGIEEIPVDRELVRDIKQRFYSKKPNITEEFIIESISKNEQNNLTTIYYLLLKQKAEEEMNKPIIENDSYKSNFFVSKKCDILNLSSIKRISFEKPNPKQSNDKQNLNFTSPNTNINNNNINRNNRFNVVVINNIVASQCSQNQNECKRKTNNNSSNNNNLVSVNLAPQKMNASISINNNIITNKINLNDMISNQLRYQKINKKLLNLNKNKRNKTASTIRGRENNFTHNLNTTLLAYKERVAKSKEIHKRKFIFNSPKSSRDSLDNKPQFINLRPYKMHNMDNKTIRKTRQLSYNNSKKNKQVNLNLMKKILEDDSNFSRGINNSSNRHEDNLSMLNITALTSGKSKNHFSLNQKHEVTQNQNIIKQKPLKTSHIMRTNVFTNIIKISKPFCKTPSNQNPLFSRNQDRREDSYHKIIRNQFALSVAHSKDKKGIKGDSSIGKKVKSNSMSKANKSNLTNQKFNIRITNLSKEKNKGIHLNKNYVNTEIGNDKHSINFTLINFANVVRKNISKGRIPAASNTLQMNASLGKKNSSNKSMKSKNGNTTPISLEHSINFLKRK